jgi:hypothetical protein
MRHFGDKKTSDYFDPIPLLGGREEEKISEEKILFQWTLYYR